MDHRKVDCDGVAFNIIRVVTVVKFHKTKLKFYFSANCLYDFNLKLSQDLNLCSFKCIKPFNKRLKSFMKLELKSKLFSQYNLTE